MALVMKSTPGLYKNVWAVRAEEFHKREWWGWRTVKVLMFGSEREMAECRRRVAEMKGCASW